MPDRWTPTELAYIAGLVDGEGCFTIKTYYNKRGNKGISASFRLAMSHKPTIDWLAEKLGGDVKLHTPATAKAKPTYRVSVMRLDAIKVFIEAVLPYLITKKEVALVVHAFCESRLSALSEAYRPTYSVSEESLAAQVRILNRRGNTGVVYA